MLLDTFKSSNLDSIRGNHAFLGDGIVNIYSKLGSTTAIRVRPFTQKQTHRVSPDHRAPQTNIWHNLSEN
jgi:hypothetical protein